MEGKKIYTRVGERRHWKLFDNEKPGRFATNQGGNLITQREQWSAKKTSTIPCNGKKQNRRKEG